MARPIVIEFAANVRDFLRGTRDVERATEDIADELKDAAKDAERFEREFQQSMRDAEREAGKASRGIERDFDRTGEAFGEVGEEAGSEFKSNLSESLASGGSPEDIITDSLAGVISGLKGPLGLAAAAIAGAAVIGFNAWREQAEQTAALVESRIEAFRERLGMLSSEMDAAFQQEQKESWILDNLDALQEMRPLLEKAGINAQEYSDAMFFGGERAQAMLDRIRAVRDTDKERIEQGDRIRYQYGEQGQAANDLLTETQALVDSQKEVNDEAATYNAFIGTARDGIYSLSDAYNTVLENMRKNPPRIKATLEWYNTGAGAAYVDPSSGNYSPGHVAINNLYTKAAK